MTVNAYIQYDIRLKWNKKKIPYSFQWPKLGKWRNNGYSKKKQWLTENAKQNKYKHDDRRHKTTSLC